MFDFIFDIGNHESRKIARYELNDVIVDTCTVSDGMQPIETGISHPEYNDGELIIVQGYDTEEEAIEGHNKWVDTLTKNPPEYLRDCGNSHISSLIEEIRGEIGMLFPRKRKDGTK